MPPSVRIAMWSGPRNLSTALMRSWGNRSDTFVTDEPLYAAYLAATGLAHPGKDEIIRTYETDAAKVTSWLVGNIPEGHSIWYQKHMAHHLLPQFDHEWLTQVSNVILIRDPSEVLLSYARKRESVSAEDLGFAQLAELFDSVIETTGAAPVVMDARDILKDPTRMLEALCGYLKVPFTDRMLSWPPGPRETDGIWAKHWYDAVETSTGFRSYAPREGQMPEKYRVVVDACMPFYEHLARHRLAAGTRLDQGKSSRK